MAKMPANFDSPFETYVVKHVLGEGGSGRVFLVTDEKGKSVALKCLFPERVSTEKRKRFKNEVDFCHKLNHPNVVRVLDFGLVIVEKAKCPFYVMPVYPMTLRKLMERGMVQDRVLHIFSQILNGVEAAHLSRVIHRDLKPENVLCNPTDDKLVIADFGIAHFEEDIIATTVNTKATVKLANLRYSAPEQRLAGSKVDHRADIFAAGLILNELFTNEVPQGAGYKSIASVNSQFAYLDQIVDRMIQQNSGSRYCSIDEVKRELISRGHEFVALQELRAKEREVVPSNAIEQVPAKNVIEVDWRQNQLSVRLSRIVENDWIQRFRQPRENFTSIGGAHPSQIQFRGDTAYIYAEERNVQSVLNFFKQHLELADRGYKKDLSEAANRRDQELRERLAHERQEAERRARVLKTIRS